MSSLTTLFGSGETRRKIFAPNKKKPIGAIVRAEEPILETMNQSYPSIDSILYDTIATYSDAYVLIRRNSTNAFYGDAGSGTATPVTLPVSADWRCGIGGYLSTTKYIFLGYNSNIGIYSTDRVNWTQFTLPVTANWISIVIGSTHIVAIAKDSNICAYSTNGTTWTLGTLPASRDWSFIGYSYSSSPQTMIAVAKGSDKGARTTDGGANWTEITFPYSKNWVSVDGFASKWYAVNEADGSSAKSTDGGVTWVSMNVTFYLPIKAVFTYSSFVCISQMSTTYYRNVYSEDYGVTWSQQGWSLTNTTPNLIPIKRTLTSYSLFTKSEMWKWDWSFPTTPETVVSYSIYPSSGIIRTVFGNGTWISLAGKLYYWLSTDRVNWTLKTFNAVITNPCDMAFANGVFVVIGSTVSEKYILTSTDGVTWTQRPHPRFAAGTTPFPKIFSNGSAFVCCHPSYPTYGILYSTDGITWSSIDTTYGSVFGVANGVYFCYEANFVYTSTNGATWTQRMNIGANLVMQGASYNDGEYFITGYYAYSGSYLQKHFKSKNLVAWDSFSTVLAGIGNTSIIHVLHLGSGMIFLFGNNIWYSNDGGATFKMTANSLSIIAVVGIEPSDGGFKIFPNSTTGVITKNNSDAEEIVYERSY
jgi:hypothetical protein